LNNNPPLFGKILPHAGLLAVIFLQYPVREIAAKPVIYKPLYFTILLIAMCQLLLHLLRFPMRKATAVVSALAFLLLPVLLKATPLPPLAFLNDEQGLSNNTVRSIFQDHNGFIWLGTFDGLNRYDGYNCKVYRHKLNDAHSLVHNFISSITEDSLHNIWIGTRQGVSRLSPLWDIFNSVYLRGNKSQPLKAVVKAVRADRSNNIFLATEDMGLLLCAQGALEAEAVPLVADGHIINSYAVKTVRMDGAGNVWALVHKYGLARYNYAAKQLVLINASLPVAGWLETQGSNLVIANGTSLFGYNPATPLPAELLNYQLQLPDAGSIITFSIDDKGRYWMNTSSGYLLSWKPGEQVTIVLSRKKDSQALSRLEMYTVFIDRQSRKWIGTATNGVAVLDPHKDCFQNLNHEPGNSNSLVDNVVSAMFEADDGIMYIGTDGGGVSAWNRQTNTFTTLLENAAVSAIKADDKHHIWIATFRQGIFRYTPATRKTDHYSLVNPAYNIEDRTAYAVLKDRSHGLWVSTLRQNSIYGALYHLNVATDKFEVFDASLSDLFTLYEDGNGVLWGGNLKQLVKIDRATKKHTFYNIGYAVRSIYEDSRGNLWLGTEGGGLQLFDRLRQCVTARYTTTEGLSSDVVLTILEDSTGHLWMSTFNGLVRFDINKRNCRNYYQADGLQSNQFHYNSALALRDGQLAFGGIKGLSLFYPEAIRVSHAMPPLQLTGVEINNKPVTEDTFYIKQVENGNIAAITLPYNKAVLTFKYSTLEYSVPNKITYAYYMEGWDRNWNYAGNLRTAAYTHLDEGSYVFRIKSTNGEGEWNPHEIAVRITVLPPWYRSWWAYILYGGCAVAAIYLFISYKTRQSRLHYEVKEAQLQTKEAQLNAQKEKEVHEKRLTFFTNLSHEFRTPLTLIIDPVKEMIEQEKEPAQKEGLHMVFRNARRLLSLVDQLLLFRKAETDADTLHLTLLNATELCREVFCSFEQQARIKKLNYRFECTNEAAELYADREKLEIILFNLLSNAIKFTPAGGTVLLKLSATDTQVNIQVNDSGAGIPAGTGDKLFNRFYQVKDSSTAGKTGFGIGLFLVKHFTTLHHGQITYESQVNKGTSFFLTLLKGAAHFTPYEIKSMEQPVAAATAPPIPEEAVVTPDKGKELSALVTEKPTLLIVDDDEDLRKYIDKVFSREFTVLQAINGQEGLTLAQQYLPDLIISDIAMDELGGIELCKQVKENPSLSHIPVILLTASTASEIRLRGIEAGADDYITKPFEKELLKARAASLLKKRNSLQQYFYNEITLQQNDGKVSVEYREFLDKCIRIVEDHLDDETFSIKTLTTEMGMSRSSLYRKVNSVSGQSIIGFIRFIRLRKAAELMINTEDNISEIASITGFNDIKYFRTHFSQLFGMNPSEYIRRFRKPFHNNLQLNKNIRKAD
jgi:signal transduction histidine kinase/ligand-binding sensor domain-containing protein/DNA-binding response OmpR family regulator